MREEFGRATIVQSALLFFREDVELGRTLWMVRRDERDEQEKKCSTVKLSQ